MAFKKVSEPIYANTRVLKVLVEIGISSCIFTWFFYNKLYLSSLLLNLLGHYSKKCDQLLSIEKSLIEIIFNEIGIESMQDGGLHFN